MKLKALLLTLALATSSMFAAEFVDYNKLSSMLKKENKANGTYATTEDVKKL